jgi:purine-binding chemotaxis protein CheW
MTTSLLEKTKDTALSSRDLLTIMIDDQIFGIPVLQVQDVLGPQRITRVPLAPSSIAGSLNLRGRIVTAINMRACLGITKTGTDMRGMSVVVENGDELYSLIFDRVGDVMSLPFSHYEKNPATLDPAWRDICAGIYRLDGRLLVVLDIPRLLERMETEKETV